MYRTYVLLIRCRITSCVRRFDWLIDIQLVIIFKAISYFLHNLLPRIFIKTIRFYSSISQYYLIPYLNFLNSNVEFEFIPNSYHITWCNGMNNIIMCTVKSNTTFIHRWENRTLIKIERRVFTRLLFFSQIFAGDIKRKQYYKRATRQIFFSFILCGFGFQFLY